MTKLQKEIVGLIQHLADEQRTHLLYEDCYRWERVKMKEIAKLVRKLPRVKPKDIPAVYKKAGIRFKNPSG